MTRSARPRPAAPAPLPVVAVGAGPDENALAVAEAEFLASLREEEGEAAQEPETESPALPIPPPAPPAVSFDEIVAAYLQANPQIIEAIVAARTPVSPAPVMGTPETDEDDDEITYPEVYSNPRIIDEQFYVLGSPYRRRFVKGRFVAQTPEERASVRACLEAHGRGFADRWLGEDRREWTCRRTGFRTSNENARYDFETYHED